MVAFFLGSVVIVALLVEVCGLKETVTSEKKIINDLLKG